MAINSEDIQKEENTFLNRACWYLGIQDRDQAGRIVRLVLHSIQARIPPKEAFRFSTHPHWPRPAVGGVARKQTGHRWRQGELEPEGHRKLETQRSAAADKWQ